ncbi:VOC family protein (plasmid) [Streptosporangium sp. CA-135522]|uniref:VOC family protein n=1 Tax=Streptosporangium sp. CA-135522 TaxID=3240072 RepID=UPI003D92BD5E
MIPTLRSVDHVAFTVPDLDAAIAFFVDHTGGELIFRDGPFVDEAGDGMTRRLNVDARAGCTLAMVRLGRLNLELFEYTAPEQSTTQPRNSDIGGHHLALYVDDVDTAHAYLSSVPGVTLMEGPNGVADDSPVFGQRWFYFTTPWGLQMEITSCADGTFYRGLPGERMAPPAEVSE